jgi:HEAT repeat protein
MAAWGLGRSEDDTAVQALRNAVQHDADERVKTTAAWALGTIGDGAATPALDAAMTDQSAKVRSRAAWALGQIEPDQAPRGLVKALSDSSDKVRLAAAWALGQIEDPGTLSALSQALSTEKDHDIREAELRALIMLGEASDATLQKLLQSPDPDVRLKVTRAIVGFRGVRPWPWPMPMPRPMP